MSEVTELMNVSKFILLSSKAQKKQKQYLRNEPHFGFNRNFIIRRDVISLKIK